MVVQPPEGRKPSRQKVSGVSAGVGARAKSHSPFSDRAHPEFKSPAGPAWARASASVWNGNANARAGARLIWMMSRLFQCGVGARWLATAGVWAGATGAIASSAAKNGERGAASRRAPHPVWRGVAAGRGPD